MPPCQLPPTQKLSERSRSRASGSTPCNYAPEKEKSVLLLRSKAHIRQQLIRHHVRQRMPGLAVASPEEGVHQLAGFAARQSGMIRNFLRLHLLNVF